MASPRHHPPGILRLYRGEGRTLPHPRGYVPTPPYGTPMTNRPVCVSQACDERDEDIMHAVAASQRAASPLAASQALCAPVAPPAPPARASTLPEEFGGGAGHWPTGVPTGRGHPAPPLSCDGDGVEPPLRRAATSGDSTRTVGGGGQRRGGRRRGRPRSGGDGGDPAVALTGTAERLLACLPP